MSVKLMSAIFETEFRDLQDAEGNTTKASTAKLVLLALADHANDEGEGAYPGLTKMERKTALSRQGIINTYTTLKHNGVINYDGISKLGTSNYTINTKCFPKANDDSQPTLLVNPLDYPSQPTLPEVVNPLDLNHTLTILKPSSASPKKGDLVDGFIDLQMKPQGIRQAFADYFKLTPNWEAKYNRQFLEWAVSEAQITPEQVRAAAELWRSDKRFNWTVPTLRGIQEHWLELTEKSKPEKPKKHLVYVDGVAHMEEII